MYLYMWVFEQNSRRSDSLRNVQRWTWQRIMALYCRVCGIKIKSIDRKYKHGHFKKLCIRCYQKLLLDGKVEGDN